MSSNCYTSQNRLNQTQQQTAYNNMTKKNLSIQTTQNNYQNQNQAPEDYASFVKNANNQGSFNPSTNKTNIFYNKNGTNPNVSQWGVSTLPVVQNQSKNPCINIFEKVTIQGQQQCGPQTQQNQPWVPSSINQHHQTKSHNGLVNFSQNQPPNQQQNNYSSHNSQTYPPNSQQCQTNNRALAQQWPNQQQYSQQQQSSQPQIWQQPAQQAVQQAWQNQPPQTQQSQQFQSHHQTQVQFGNGWNPGTNNHNPNYGTTQQTNQQVSFTHFQQQQQQLTQQQPNLVANNTTANQQKVNGASPNQPQSQQQPQQQSQQQPQQQQQQLHQQQPQQQHQQLQQHQQSNQQQQQTQQPTQPYPIIQQQVLQPNYSTPSIPYSEQHDHLQAIPQMIYNLFNPFLFHETYKHIEMLRQEQLDEIDPKLLPIRDQSIDMKQFLLMEPERRRYRTAKRSVSPVPSLNLTKRGPSASFYTKDRFLKLRPKAPLSSFNSSSGSTYQYKGLSVTARATVHFAASDQTINDHLKTQIMSAMKPDEIKSRFLEQVPPRHTHQLQQINDHFKTVDIQKLIEHSTLSSNLDWRSKRASYRYQYNLTVAEQSYLPLFDDQYVYQPTPQELSQLPETELKHLPSITISNPFGQVQFKGDVDITYIDFKRCLTITQQGVELYSGISGTQLPAINSKLNRTYIVTMIIPSNNDQQSQIDLARRHIESVGGMFLAYDSSRSAYLFEANPKLQH